MRIDLKPTARLLGDHYGDETNQLNAVRPEEWTCVFKRRRRKEAARE